MTLSLTTHTLSDGEHTIMTGSLPEAFCSDDAAFESYWDLHPKDYSEIMIHGRAVLTPRWQQSYGRDYQFSGQINEALSLTPEMEALLAWCQDTIDPRLDGLLFNWYDGERDHYIGAHRDSRKGLVSGTPIVTISLGEQRAFRMRPYKGKGFEDFTVDHRAILIIPWSTNLAYTHEVPNAARHRGRRISITARAFEHAGE